MSRQLAPTEVKRLNRFWRRLAQARVCLLLESVSQPFNVGSIIRTAAAFGVERVWMCGEVADPAHPSARKTALGAGRFMRFDRAASVAEAASAVRQAGLRLVAIELALAAVPLHQAAVGGDVCLAFGNEDRGCSAALLAAADQVAYIPQVGRVGSLNVAAAAGIVLAEARRREWAAGGPGGSSPQVGTAGGAVNAGPSGGASVDSEAADDQAVYRHQPRDQPEGAR